MSQQKPDDTIEIDLDLDELDATSAELKATYQEIKINGFLGMHHRRMTTETSKGQLYKETYQYPSRKAMKKMKAEIKKNVNGRSLLVAKEEDLIKNLNPKIIGWKNYYSTKTNETWMQELDWYIICTFTRWYNKKHQRRKHMSRVGFVRNSIYEKGLKKMARA